MFVQAGLVCLMKEQIELMKELLLKESEHALYSLNRRSEIISCICLKNLM